MLPFTPYTSRTYTSSSLRANTTKKRERLMKKTLISTNLFIHFWNGNDVKFTLLWSFDTLIVVLSRTRYHEILIDRALIGALDVARHPENIRKKAAILHLKSKPNADSLPLTLKFEVECGDILPMEMAKSMIIESGAQSQLEGFDEAREYWVNRGNLGVALLVYSVDDKYVFVVRSVMIALQNIRRIWERNQKYDPWDSENWVWTKSLSFLRSSIHKSIPVCP
jgi:hypothetical protein